MRFSADSIPPMKFLKASGLAVVFIASLIVPLPAAESLNWTDIRELCIEGQGWKETKAPYDRLPAKAEGKVRAAVWSLSRNSAGMHVRFVIDAKDIHARWAVTSNRLAMPHMAAT